MKAILVLEMPSSCDKCPLFGSFYRDMTCRGNGRGINYPYPKEVRQDWCPLKLMVGKKSDGETLKVAIENDCYDGTTEDKAYFAGYDKGYNACIDEILGDKE